MTVYMIYVNDTSSGCRKIFTYLHVSTIVETLPSQG
jgi:hypothetical protein